MHVPLKLQKKHRVIYFQELMVNLQDAFSKTSFHNTIVQKEVMCDVTIHHTDAMICFVECAIPSVSV